MIEGLISSSPVTSWDIQMFLALVSFQNRLRSGWWMAPAAAQGELRSTTTSSGGQYAMTTGT